MTSATVFLIRHAVTEWNSKGWTQGHRDVPLNKKGQIMAALLAERLREVPFAAIYSSDLRRAQETAKVLADMHGHSLVTDLRLRERRVKEPYLSNEYPVLPAPKDIETLQDIEQRMHSCLEMIARKHQGSTVAVVSHGGAIRVFLESVFEEVPPRPPGLGSNTSIQHLTWSQDAGWRIQRFHDCDHLINAGIVGPELDAG